MYAKKSLGQNFLMHARIAERIVMESGITENDTVLEIGPGTGMLTTPLLARARKVIAVEADADLVEGLREKFAAEISAGKLELTHADIRAFDPESIGEPYRLAANIPYYLTGEIIRDFLSASAKPLSMTILVQKEVAERIARDEKGSILSIAVRVYGTPAYLFTVPRGAFNPAPSVDSAVLHVADIHDPFSSTGVETRFFEVLKAGFAHKRKRLAKNLASVASNDAIDAAFTALVLDTDARAEEIPVATWVKLAQSLS